MMVSCLFKYTGCRLLTESLNRTYVKPMLDVSKTITDISVFLLL